MLQIVKSAAIISVCLLSAVACTVHRAHPIHSEKGITSGIIGGTDVASSDPIAKVVVGIANLQTEITCTGSILDHDLILTAAHCLEGDPEDTVIIFGTDFDAQNRVLRAATAYVAHPAWNADTADKFNHHDIGLIRFDGGLPPGYETVELLQERRLLVDGAPTIVAGYGSNDSADAVGGEGILRQAEVAIESVFTAQTEVTLDQSADGAACVGDSGGPAFIYDGDKNLLWGVFSRLHQRSAEANEICTQFSIYTVVPKHITWMKEAAQNLRALDREPPPLPDPDFRFFKD